jgi:tryptophan-rich sensory protein
MKSIGWEMRPLGWVILIALIGISSYIVYKRILNEKQK